MATILELAASLGLDINEAEWKDASKYVAQMVGQLKRLAFEAATATTDVKKATGTIGLGGAEAKNHLDALHSTAQGVGSSLKWLIGLAGGLFAVSRVEGLIKDTVDAGSKLNDLSQAANVPIQKLQELGFAASQNSSNMDELALGLVHLSKNAGLAAAGGKEQAEAFRTMGISVKDAGGKLRPVEDIFADVADRMQATRGATTQTNEAVAVLGKTGYKLIPTLNDGSAGLRAYAQAAQDAGGIITDETVHALDDLGDTTDTIKFSLAGLRNQIVTDMLPTLQAMANDFLEWVKANKKLIAQRLTTIFKGIIAAVKVLATVVGVVIRVFAFFIKHADLVGVALAALVITMGIFRAASIVTAIETAAAWVLAALPFVLIAVLIGAVILVLEDLYRAFTGGKSVLKDFYEAAKESIGKGIAGVINGLIDKINEAIHGLELLADKAGSLIEDHPYLFATVMGGNAELVKNLREQQRRNGQTTVPDLGRVGALKQGALDSKANQDAAASMENYNTPEAAAIRAANMAKRAAAAPQTLANAISSSAVNSFTASVNITPPAGADAKDFGAHAVKAIEGWWDGMMRKTQAATGAK